MCGTVQLPYMSVWIIWSWTYQHISLFVCMLRHIILTINTYDSITVDICPLGFLFIQGAESNTTELWGNYWGPFAIEVSNMSFNIFLNGFKVSDNVQHLVDMMDFVPDHMSSTGNLCKSELGLVWDSFLTRYQYVFMSPWFERQLWWHYGYLGILLHRKLGW